MTAGKRTLSPEALALRDFLTAISGRYTLSGQHNYISTASRYTALVERATGRRPLVWGSDFSFALGGSDPGRHYHCGPLNISDPVDTPRFLGTTAEEAREALIAEAMAQHGRGHVITLMWHCPLPQHGDVAPTYDAVWAMENRPDAATWRELTTPGTALHAQWLAQIDRIAAYLARLRDARIPVLWRPYHEMNGVWFWWCNQRGPDGFARLWRLMWERYTHHHHLDNLLWVWNSNAPRDRAGDEAYDYSLFYPGGETVDVLAADVYGNDYRPSHHDDLAALAEGRPIALGEVGQMPTPENPRAPAPLGVVHAVGLARLHEGEPADPPVALRRRARALARRRAPGRTGPAAVARRGGARQEPADPRGGFSARGRVCWPRPVRMPAAGDCSKTASRNESGGMDKMDATDRKSSSACAETAAGRLAPRPTPLPAGPLRRAFLVVPPTGRFIREDRCQTPIDHMATIALRPPVELLYAAAALEKAGVECRLTDYPAEERSLADLEADVREFAPGLVILSITTPGLEADMAVAARIREVAPGTVVAAKGAHFNTLDLDALGRYPGLDLALRGEHEETCREIAEGRPWAEIRGIAYRDAAGTPVRTTDRPFVEDLDSLPFPARHLANNRLYLRPDTGAMQTTIVTNRGCPFSCIYCLANQVAGRRNRMRSPGNILAEIEECVTKYGIRSFLFRSDLFTANREWLLELCRGIRERGLRIDWSCNSRVDTLDEEMLREMKAAGCWIVAFGIESGSQEMLDRINKRTDLAKALATLKMTRRAGLLSSIYFLVGLPWETEATLAANERFARELDPDIVEVFYVYPFPGTPLYAECVRLGLLAPGEVPRSAYDGPAMPALAMTREELAAARNRALRRFYMRPRVIARTLWRTRSATELWNYVRYGLRQLKEII